MFNENKFLFMSILDDGGDGGAPAPEGDGTPAPEGDPAPVEDFVLPDFLKDVEMDDDIKSEKSLLNFKSIGDLAKSYVHAKKFVGADKIAIPGKHASEDDWNKVYEKLGRPESNDKYDIKVKEELGFDDTFISSFKEAAFNSGLLPKQAQNLMDFYQKNVEDLAKDYDSKKAVALEENRNALTEEWGAAYDSNINAAKYAIKEFGDDDMLKHLKELGVDSDAKVLKMLAKAGKALSGDSFPGINNTKGGPLSPQEAMAEMDNIRMDPTHPVNIATHPGHAHAIKELEKLASFAYRE